MIVEIAAMGVKRVLFGVFEGITFLFMNDFDKLDCTLYVWLQLNICSGGRFVDKCDLFIFEKIRSFYTVTSQNRTKKQPKKYCDTT